MSQPPKGEDDWDLIPDWEEVKAERVQTHGYAIELEDKMTGKRFLYNGGHLYRGPGVARGVVNGKMPGFKQRYRIRIVATRIEFHPLSHPEVARV